MHPELSNREERTSRVVAERLRAIAGIEVRTGVARHGVVGVLRGGKPGPVVALRADMDALPIEETNDVPYKSKNAGVKHACGHDAHTAMLLGAAELLSGMRAELAGTVVFVFQPAEEGAPDGEPGGATLMIKDGALASPKADAIFGLHVMPTLESGTVGLISGSAMASADKFTITIKGKSAHGANPQDSVDPIVVAAECVEALQTIRSRRVHPQEGFVLSVGSIHGGTRFNIIADEVVLVGTMRTLDEKRARTRSGGCAKYLAA
ncbi:MAG: amidohydrolase [Blastocatellia bacterium]|nr:amidohydrolase [Blastocatellia bacterium]